MSYVQASELFLVWLNDNLTEADPHTGDKISDEAIGVLREICKKDAKVLFKLDLACILGQKSVIFRKWLYLDENKNKDSPVLHSLKQALDSNGCSLLKNLFGLLREVKKSYPNDFLEKLLECIDLRYIEKENGFKILDFEVINYFAELIIGLLSCLNLKQSEISAFEISVTKITSKIEYYRRIMDVRVVSELKTIRDRYHQYINSDEVLDVSVT